jgi:uncharacterized protein
MWHFFSTSTLSSLYRTLRLMSVCLSLTWIHTSSAQPLQTVRVEPAEQAAQTAYEQGNARLAQLRFTRLAEKGNPWAMYNLAAMHMHGEAKPSSSLKAKYWLEQAAAQAYPQALYILGQAYEGGQFGIKNLTQAAQYYGLAAQAGSQSGRVEYATALFLGRGIAQDLNEAGHWYLEAAKAGDKDMQFMVARMFETGQGRALDERLARYWYAVAAKNGDIPSQAKIFAYERADARMSNTPTAVSAP